jgi:hypothetical protein
MDTNTISPYEKEWGYALTLSVIGAGNHEPYNESASSLEKTHRRTGGRHHLPAYFYLEWTRNRDRRQPIGFGRRWPNSIERSNRGLKRRNEDGENENERCNSTQNKAGRDKLSA